MESVRFVEFFPLPASRVDINAFNKRFDIAHPQIWVEHLRLLAREVGVSPHMKFLFARARHELDMHLKKVQAQAREERRRITAPLREAALHAAIYKLTGCCVEIAPRVEVPEIVISDWDAEQAEYQPVVKRVRGCEHWFGVLSDREQFLYYYPPSPVAEKPRPVRSIMLLYKLRALIRALREKRTKGFIPEWSAPEEQYVKPMPQREIGVPEMEGVRGEELNKISSGNVTLTEENQASTSVATRTDSAWQWTNMCSAEKAAHFSDLTSRWTLYKNFEWTKSHAANTEIPNTKLDLPYDFVNSAKNKCDMPMFAPFRLFRYCKTDIEVKIHVNSNKFQSGQLQFSWQYLEKFDKCYMSNMYSRSQLPHVLVNAGSSNEATLIIPYKNMLPYITTAQCKSQYDCLYLGTLRCFVVSPLRTGTNGPDECGFSIFIRFPNCEFVGMRDGGVGEMMEAAAAGAALGVVDHLLGDRNCDEPTASSHINYLVPTASHSWSIGSGYSPPMHKLVLDDNKQSVGRPSGLDMSDTAVTIPIRTFGMIKSFKWTTSSKDKNKYGYLLWNIDAHPQIAKSLVYKETVAGGLDKYANPPISVVAGLFKQWRGSIEFRFDIVCSQYHTGRLLVAYIPGFTGDVSKVTLEQARNSPHTEFTLQDSGSFTFIVPYIAHKPWWPRKYAGPSQWSEWSAPSKVLMFILNPLVHMESITPEVDIIVYARGGEDFEVSVPVQSTLGLSVNTAVNIANKYFIYPTTGSYPYRVSNSRQFGDSKKCIFYEGTDTLGTVSAFHAPEGKLGEDEYYYGKAVNVANQPTMTYKSHGTSQEYNSRVGFIVLWWSGSEYWGIPFPNNAEGERYASNLAYYIKANKSLEEKLALCYDFVRDTSVYSTGDSRFQPQEKKIPSLRSDAHSESSEFEVVGEPEVDERLNAVNSLNPVQYISSTGFGSLMYNEKFIDFKDILRRFQLYCDSSINIPKSFISGEAVIKIPLIPSGLTLDTNLPKSIFNIFRDGNNSVIASAFVFFRGGMRCKIVFSTDNLSIAGGKFWIQHIVDSPTPRRRTAITYPNIVEAEKYRNHGYAFYMQSANINSIVEVEIPFYQPGMYGLNYPITEIHYSEDLAQYTSIGDLLIGLNIGTVNQPLDVHFQLFSSISDDFSYSVFKGYPMTVFCDEVWNPDSVARPEMEPIEKDSGEPQMFNAIAQGIVSSMAGSVAMNVVRNGLPTPSNLKDRMVAAIKKEIRDAIQEPCLSLKYTLSHQLLDIKKDVVSLVETGPIVNVIGNLVHVLANPTPKTLAIAIGNILASFLCVGIGAVNIVSKALDKLLSINWSAFVGGRDVGNHQMAGNPTNANVGCCAALFTIVCTVCGLSLPAPGSYFNLMRNISFTAGLFNNVIQLIKNSQEFLTKAFFYIAGILQPNYKLEADLAAAAPTVKQWFEECTYLLDARKREELMYNKQLLDRVFNAADVGAVFVSAGLNESVYGGKVVYDTYKDIIKVRNDMIEKNVHPDVRFETFPLFFTGPPGIGKSHMTDQLVSDLLTAVNHKQKGPAIYYIKPAAKYWTNCVYPAALVSDDMFQVSGTRLEEEIGMLFEICSCSVLNPPFAEVENKHRRINPLLYIMHCNSAFPDFGGTARCKEAVYRRRQYLVEVALTDAIKEKYPNFRDARELTADEKRNFAHLQFRYAFNVKDPQTEYSEWMTYDGIMALITYSFVRHYQEETQNFKRRMDNIYRFDDNYNPANVIEEFPELGDLMSLEDQVNDYIEICRLKIAQNIIQYEDMDSIDFYKRRLHETWTAARAEISDIYDRLTTRFQMDDEGSVSDVSSIHTETSSDDWIGLLSAKIKKDITKECPVDSYKKSLTAKNPLFTKRYFDIIHVPGLVDYKYINSKFVSIPNTSSKWCSNLDVNNMFFHNMNDTLFKSLESKFMYIMGSVLGLHSGIGAYKYDDFCKLCNFEFDEYFRLSIYASSMEEYESMLPNETDTAAQYVGRIGDMIYRSSRANFLDDDDAIQQNAATSDFVSNNTSLINIVRTLYTDEKFKELKLKYRILVKNLYFNFIHNHYGNSSTTNFELDKILKQMKEVFDNVVMEEDKSWEEQIMLGFGSKFLMVSAEAEEIFQFCSILFYQTCNYVFALLKPLPRCVGSSDRASVSRVGYKVKYCSFTNKFTALSNAHGDLNHFNINMCDCAHSMCSDDLMFGLFAACCLTCNNPLRFNKDMTKVLLDPKVFARRKVNEKKNFLSNVADNVMCFFVHQVPKFMIKAFYYIMKFLPYIMSALATVGGFYKLYQYWSGSEPMSRSKACLWGAVTLSGVQEGVDLSQADCREAYNKHVNEKFNSGYTVDTAWYESKLYETSGVARPLVSGLKVNSPVAVPQGNPIAQTSFSNLLKYNSVHLTALYNDGGEKSLAATCLVLGGRSMLVIRHYIEHWKAIIDRCGEVRFVMMYAKKNLGAFRVLLHERDIMSRIAFFGRGHTIADPLGRHQNLSVCDSNFGIIELPNSVPAFKSLVPYIATEHEHNNVSLVADLYNPFLENHYGLEIREQRDYYVDYELDGKVSPVEFKKGYSYLKHGKGMCGTILVSPNLNSGGGKILGMHVAGSSSSGRGCAEVITYEMITSYQLALKDKMSMPAPEVPIAEGEKPKFDFRTNLNVLGAVAPELAHRESGKTKIVPSLLYNVIYPPKTQPNPLKPNDKRQPPGSDPLRDGCAKHGTGDVISFSPELLALVQADIDDRLRQIVRPVRCKVQPLTLQQAACGDSVVPYFDPLNWKSSEGFPLSSERPSAAHDKRWLFNATETSAGYILDTEQPLHPSLQKVLDERAAAFEAGSRYPNIYVDCLKDYRLTPEKCAIPGKTRIFSVAPVQCTLDIKTYMNDFCASIKNSRIYNSIGIGINPDSMEWTDLANYLLEVGTNIITLDYKNFGPCLSSQVASFACSSILNWFKNAGAADDHVARVRWLLENDILLPYHLCANVVYVAANGIASGSPLTGELNSIVNLDYVRLIYLEIFNVVNPALASMFYFNQYVRIVVYGDDLIMSVSPVIVEYFNALTIKEQFLKHNIEVTPAQKSSEMVAYSSLEESTFLKRSFARHPTRAGVWLAPLDTDSIEEVVNWVHVSDDPRTAVVEACRSSMDLAYGRGPQYYSLHYNRLRDSLNALGISFFAPDWFTKDNFIFNTDVDSLPSDLFSEKINPHPIWYNKHLIPYFRNQINQFKEASRKPYNYMIEPID